MGALARRLGHSVFLLLGVSVLTFALTELAPGDYFDDLRLDPEISPRLREDLRQRHGLDRPLVTRYVEWLGAVARGDLGPSFANQMPVSEILWTRARNTLVLTSVATLLAWLVAVPCGVWAAARRGRVSRGLFAGATSLFLAVPDLVLALGLLLLAVRTGLFPTGGMASPGAAALDLWGRLADLARHLVLPVAALVLTTAPLIARHVQSSMSEALRSPFIRAARASGVSARRLLFRYALPAAANPLISLLGVSIASLLSASLLVEIIMSWPGMGPMLLDAILARDVYLVIAAVMVSTLFLIGGNLVADLLLYAADPRVREEG